MNYFIEFPFVCPFVLTIGGGDGAKPFLVETISSGSSSSSSSSHSHSPSSSHSSSKQKTQMSNNLERNELRQTLSSLISISTF
jgi:hypothetical protein